MKRLAWFGAMVALFGVGFAWGVATVKYRVWPYWLARPHFEYENAPSKIRQAYYARRAGPAEIVFIGDSIFRLIEMSEEFPNREVRNRAIDGQTTEEVLGRVGTLKAMDAETYVIMVGTNDILRGVEPEAAVANIARVVAALPGRKLILAIPPCNPTRSGCNQQAIDEANGLLADIRGAEFVTYAIDPVSQLQDVVHPTPDGLDVLVDAVRRHL